VHFQRTLQRFVPSDLVTSPSRFHARDVTNPVTALAEPTFVLNKLSDRFPVPNRCPDCGTHWTDTANCPRFRCPMLDYFQREPSNMHAAAVHRPQLTARTGSCAAPMVCFASGEC